MAEVRLPGITLALKAHGLNVWWLVGTTPRQPSDTEGAKNPVSPAEVNSQVAGWQGKPPDLCLFNRWLQAGPGGQTTRYPSDPPVGALPDPSLVALGNGPRRDGAFSLRCSGPISQHN